MYSHSQEDKPPHFTPFLPAQEKDRLMVEVDGFEGPLDLLLHLARRQKLDLTKISILALAEQYLAYVERIKSERIDLAAEYLLTAAWLAYLKSRLLLPKTSEEAQSAESEAAHLAWRLKRLEAMREAAQSLMGRFRLGLDVFPRGKPEGLKITRVPLWRASLHDLLHNYAAIAVRRMEHKELHIAPRPVFSLAQARQWLESLFGVRELSWKAFEALLPTSTPELARSARASTFAAALHLAAEGKVELQQEKPFDPLFLRLTKSVAAPATEDSAQTSSDKPTSAEKAA